MIRRSSHADQRLIISKFWQQTLRQILTQPASFLTCEILRLPRGGLVNRYMRIFLTFYLSGALHVLAEYAGGRHLQDSGTLRFFSTQVLGIMIEDGAQAVYRSARASRKDVPLQFWARSLGYTWVIVFLFWSSPAWIYPDAAEQPKPTVLPFTIMS